jgi:hypothetical protein
MLTGIESLQISKKENYYELEFTTRNESGEKIVVNSRIRKPFMQVSTNSDSKHLNPYILNKTASFHFNADALQDDKGNLFTITIEDKKRKAFTPKKHRKYSKTNRH